MAGMNRCAGDFTVLAGFPVSEFQDTDFNPRWIRQPDSDDPPESICVWTPYVNQPESEDAHQKQMSPIDYRVCQSQNRYVLEMRKGHLSHTTGMAIRPDDTIGMFRGGMTLLFDPKSEEELQKEALLGKAALRSLLAR